MADLDFEDISDLISCIRVDRPAFYKDEFHISASSQKIVGVLLRHGVKVRCDPDTGRISHLTTGAQWQ